MTYYSQIGQDKYVYENVYKSNKKDGYFLDIGAYDGVTFSNTLFFEQLGWKGCCVEPASEPFQKLKAARKCVCLEYPIWSKSGEIDFIEISSECEDKEAPMLSGIKKAMDPRHISRIDLQTKGIGQSVKRLKAITINQLLIGCGVSVIDYMSIDTEGSEREIIHGIDFDSWRINVISVENNFNDQELRDYLKNKGYEFIQLEWDDIFVRKELWE